MDAAYAAPINKGVIVHIRVMRKTARLLFVGILFRYANIAAAQNNFGLVLHWDDLSRMDCPFYFEQEPLLEWDQSNPPPISIETAAAIARVKGEEKGLENVWVNSFRLIGVRPHEHDYPMLVMFVNFQGFPKGNRGPMYGDDNKHWIAITPIGKVVEESCEDAQ